MPEYIFGLTGPTGAGKSIVAAELQRQGCTILDCDRIAHQVTEECVPCLAELRREFGDEVFQEDGTLNRTKLAEKAFSSADNTRKLNAITHPWISRRVQQEIQRGREQGKQLFVVDAPLLFEAGTDALCDRILVVLASADLRMQRIMQRDHLTEALAKARMQAQPDDAFYLERADVCLDGTLSADELSCQVRQIIRGVEE